MINSLRRFLLPISLTVIFILGLGVRLIDLNDPPLDFNPTRQLRSAIIARGLYYESAADVDPEQKELAITHMKSMERLEPPLFEILVSWTYRLWGGENLAAARVLASVFWLVGGVFLFDLGRRITSPWAALVGVCVFLFLPFSIRASRSFQPDPGMVTLIIITSWATYRWSKQRTWKWALLAGLFGGMAVLVKLGGIFFVGGITFGVLIHKLGIDASPQDGEDAQWRISNLNFGWRDPQLWLMAVLILVLPLIYYLAGLRAPNSSSFLHWTILNRWQDVLSPSFYMRWMVQLDEILGLGLVCAALIGSLLTKPQSRGMLWGFWLGYFIFCLFFPYHTLTHDYYHLPLVALISLSLMPLANLVIGKVRQQGVVFQAGLVFVLVLFFSYNAWIGRSILVGQDFRKHPEFWQTVGDAIPSDSKVIGLYQDYRFRLMYDGWQKIALWPNNAQPDDLAEIAPGASYFLVTAKNQMGAALEDYLHTHYAIHAEGPGYIIFDLHLPIEP